MVEADVQEPFADSGAQAGADELLRGQLALHRGVYL